MEYVELLMHEINAPVSKFWRTIDMWLNNPHLINRRILTSITISTGELDDEEDFLNVIANIGSSPSAAKILSDVTHLVKPLDIDPFAVDSGVYVFVRKLMPRDNNGFSEAVEFSIVNKCRMSVICVSKSLNSDKRTLGFPLPYQIIFSERKVQLSVMKGGEKSEDSAVRWLKEKFFPRLVRWMESEHKKPALVEGSLHLVPAEKYTNLYNALKKRYGVELVKKWPECTDPAKFVYEDIAIATYLLLLWEEERQKENLEQKQTFVDLGCGNGLLVYILTMEGHPGVGIDLRRRKIWDLFSESRLEERTIIPSSKSLFPEADWLIGNHSDELTPWIPVIAARSSYACRFFLLPCCAHEFDGRKFQRDSASGSQYSEYLKYVKSICEACGFVTQLDKLRIPSTKRTCLVGLARTYPESAGDLQDQKIEEVISARSLTKMKNVDADEWAVDFKPRDAVERVRNCTQVDRKIIDDIVSLVSSELLRKTRKVTINDGTWNAGGQMELNEVAKLIPPETLKQLKNECGGLQTVLKNNGHIFQVLQGCVQFRVPGSESKKRKKPRSKIQRKVKPCWFFHNHPDGCPLPDDNCNFRHDR